MFWFKKNTKSKEKSNDRNHSERLFFHDIINLTHGLILFLHQRQSQNKIINIEEVKLLEKEIRTLQSLVKDHFHYQHKNLLQSYDWVPFNIAEAAVDALIKTYLPKESVQTLITKTILTNNKASVYFPVFYRIMNNLIKNMGESGTTEVYINFKFDDSGLTIQTKNLRPIDIGLVDNDGQENSSGSFDDSIESVGLESIYHLSLESGGKFEFQISGNWWIGLVYLPNQQNISQIINTKKAA